MASAVFSVAGASQNASGRAGRGDADDRLRVRTLALPPTCFASRGVSRTQVIEVLEPAGLAPSGGLHGLVAKGSPAVVTRPSGSLNAVYQRTSRELPGTNDAFDLVEAFIRRDDLAARQRHPLPACQIRRVAKPLELLGPIRLSGTVRTGHRLATRVEDAGNLPHPGVVRKAARRLAGQPSSGQVLIPAEDGEDPFGSGFRPDVRRQRAHRVRVRRDGSIRVAGAV